MLKNWILFYESRKIELENQSWKFKIKSNSKLSTIEVGINKLEDIIKKLTQNIMSKRF